MKIAILGWGSLIWDPRNLEIDKRIGKNGWLDDGPVLPIEFSRISQDGRLTLVIDPIGVDVKTLYAISQFEDFDQARLDLAAREGCSKAKIGYFVKSNGDFHSRSRNIQYSIESWANLKEEIDAVIWTDLASTFKDKMGMELNLENAINYLKYLPADSRVKAEQYIRRAPNSVITPIRTAVEEKLQWAKIIDPL